MSRGADDAERPLLERLTQATGLHRTVAPFTVRRVLLRVGVMDPTTVTTADLRRALPHFRQALQPFFVDSNEYHDALVRLERLATA